jgi:hypothetical protein
MPGAAAGARAAKKSQWGPLRRHWGPHDNRDQIVDYVNRWTVRVARSRARAKVLFRRSPRTSTGTLMLLTSTLPARLYLWRPSPHDQEPVHPSFDATDDRGHKESGAQLCGTLQYAATPLCHRLCDTTGHIGTPPEGDSCAREMPSTGSLNLTVPGSPGTVAAFGQPPLLPFAQSQPTHSAEPVDGQKR